MTQPTTMQTSPLKTMLPLFLVLFIDSMGLGLLFPILNSVIVDPAASFLAQNVTMPQREFLYGALIGVFMLCWFFGAAILGDLSDIAGRKKSLMICLVGAFFGYVLAAISIVVGNLWLLFISRIIAGFTAGSQPIAQAAIVDISTPENKARNIGLMLLAISLGFVFGPICGGLMSDNNLVHWFTFDTPFYFAGIISLLNAILLWVFFKETHVQTKKVKIRLHHAFNIFISAFKHPRVRLLSIVLLVMILGWNGYFSFISMFVLEKFHYSTLWVSLFMGVLGSGFAVGCGYMVNIANKYLGLKNAIVSGFLITAVGILLTALTNEPAVAWICAFIIGVSLGVGYSDLITLFSNQVNEDEQGWVMGVTGSVMALSCSIVAFVFGYLVPYGISIPILSAGIGVLLAAIILCFLRNFK